MRVTLDIDFSKFHSKCQATISKVAQSTLGATEEACQEIMHESLKQVPRDTETLANSAFYDISKAPDYGFQGEVGYSGTAVNPKSNQSVMDYAVVVHEDLNAIHPVGKAKFLEDPIREYAQENFPRTVIKHMKPILDGENNE